MKVKNLFGEMQEMEPEKNRSKYQKIKAANRYRKGDIKRSCKNCGSCVKVEYHNSNYYKCKRIGIIEMIKNL